MWIFTTAGFVSAVQHRENPEDVLVRSRDRKSLEILLDNVELAGAEVGGDGRAVEKLTTEDIVEMDAKSADYRYRVRMSKATFALAIQHEILNFVDYDSHFKEAAAAQRGKAWYQGLLQIWTIGLDYFDDKTGKIAAPKPVAKKKGKKAGVKAKAGAWW
jgi:hypothetical protein